jgi:hypothetical protein
MKIKQNTVEDIAVGVQNESYFAGIDPANYAKVFMMISESLYTNPIGSFIREIVSNAIDANTTANVDKPVIINLFKEDLINYLTVKDEGVGMSDEEMKSVYMSIFKSNTSSGNQDKRIICNITMFQLVSVKYNASCCYNYRRFIYCRIYIRVRPKLYYAFSGYI